MIDEPNLSCGKCFELYEKPGGVEPLCFSGGCPIEDLATDVAVNAAISEFMRAKALYAYTEDPEILRRMHERLGLYDDPGEHIQIEEIFRKWSEKEAKKGELSSSSGISGGKRAKQLKRLL